jgi:hypothetical protein
MGGFEALKSFVEHPIDAFSGCERFFYAPVDFAAVALDVENGGGANGKFKNARGIIAFMGPAHLEISQAERIDHFRRTGYKGDDSHSPNIALAFFGCGLFGEQFFEFLGLLLGFAKQRDIQEADLELDFRSDLHNHLYRAYDVRSIDM